MDGYEQDPFLAYEEQDGVRFSWNVWPNSRVEATKCVVPLGVFYTPLKPIQNLQIVSYAPVPCKSCGAVLNPYAALDFVGKLWTCSFCHTRNHFPAHYQGMTEECRVAELYPQYTTIEYTMPRTTAPAAPPAYVFVIDVTVAEDELRACCAAVGQALQMLPEDARVALVTFGTHVQVYELGFSDCVKSFVFKGTKEYTQRQVLETLGLAPRGSTQGGPGGKGAGQQQQGGMAQGTGPGGAPAGAARFVLPVSECEYVITGILDELQRDAFPTVPDYREARATGTALQVAASVMGGCLPPGSCLARLMLFVGGPTTEGAGRVVEKEKSEPIRSHKDLVKGAAPLYAKAAKFYDSVGQQLVAQGHALDVFAVALEQVGLAEMKGAVERTGGLSVQTDTYNNPVFTESLKRVCAQPGEEGYLGLAGNATFEVFVSRDIKVGGLLGPAASMDKRSAAVSDTPVGVGGTTAWKAACLDSDTTFAVLFDVVGGKASGKGGAAGSVSGGPDGQLFLQFQTKYSTASGESRCRVTTVTRGWVDGSNPQDLIGGFDQEAAAVLMARLASYKMEAEEDFDATRWLDRMLIRLSQRFGEYSKDDPGSFQLYPQMTLYPQFMFNLRRSHFVQVFGYSPDETAHARLLLDRQPVGDGVVMIQPQIFKYDYETPGAEPVMLDVTSISPDRILFLDAFHYVVVFSGTTIAQWRAANYHHQPEHAALAQLMQAPKDRAQEVSKRRFPMPRVVECDQNTSQSRFLLARLNPSSTYNSSNPMSSEVIMTDDVSLEVFFDHLKKLAVAS